MALVTLPASVAFIRGLQVVQYVHEDVETHGLLIAGGDLSDVRSPLAKLEVVPARSGNGRVHIRCSYNNKYLAIRREGDDSIVAPVAEEPVEDESAWGCTMFLPTYASPNSTLEIHLLHVQRGRHLFIHQQTSVLGVLDHVSGTPATANHMVFSFVDLAPLFMMPRYVAFKGDNGNYLRFATINRQPFLQFSSAAGVDKWHPSVVHETFISDNLSGRYRIKCHSSNVNEGFWRRDRGSDDHWILADSVERPNNSPLGHYWGDSGFAAVKLGENAEGIIVAFRNGQFASNTNYLARRTTSRVQHGLSAHGEYKSIVPEARLVVEELVRSRLIYNVRFNRLDTRIYSNAPDTMSSQHFENRTSVAQNMGRTFTFSLSKTSTWNATVSTTVGVSTTFRTGVPFIADGEISTSVEATTAYEWGRSYTEEETREDYIDITVPPMSRVTVSRLETRGTCDVPFSYSQEDTLFNGEKVVYEKHDGLYTGVNSFDIHYLAREESLPGSTNPQETITYPVVPSSSRVLSKSSSEPAAHVDPSHSSE